MFVIWVCTEHEQTIFPYTYATAKQKNQSCEIMILPHKSREVLVNDLSAEPLFRDVHKSILKEGHHIYVSHLRVHMVVPYHHCDIWPKLRETRTALKGTVSGPSVLLRPGASNLLSSMCDPGLAV